MDSSRERKKSSCPQSSERILQKQIEDDMKNVFIKKIVIKIYLLLNEIENGHKTTSKHTAKDFASSTLCTTIFLNFVLLT